MNVNDILSENEEILYQGQQRRVVPGGKEITPGQIFVTSQRVILESTEWLGLKKSYEDLHYSDILGMDLKKNVFSCDLVIRSRFEDNIQEIHIKAISKQDAPQLEKVINERMNNYRFGAGFNSNVRSGG
jgi:hypothetical protein